MGGLDDDLDPFTLLDDPERIGHPIKGQAMGQEVDDRHASRGNQLERLPVVTRRRPIGADNVQLPVVDQV